jgi:hypothetical protein
MSVAGIFTDNTTALVTLRRPRPRLSARQRVEQLICRLVVVTVCVMAGAVVVPIIFTHPQDAQSSAQVVMDNDDAGSAAGSPVRVIPIYHEQD